MLINPKICIVSGQPRVFWVVGAGDGNGAHFTTLAAAMGFVLFMLERES